jgi:hypothetical protein
MRAGSNGIGRRPPPHLRDELVDTGPPLDEPPEPLRRGKAKVLLHQERVLIVPGDDPDGEVEAAGADRSDDPLERGGGRAPFPPGDYRLRRRQPLGKLTLGQTRPLASLADQLTSMHGRNDTIISIKEISKKIST